MNQIMARLIAFGEDRGDPYFDLQDIGIEFDIRNPNVENAFEMMVSRGYVDSPGGKGCGFERGADGLVQWSVVDLYVTSAGKAAILEAEANPL